MKFLKTYLILLLIVALFDYSAIATRSKSRSRLRANSKMFTKSGKNSLGMSIMDMISGKMDKSLFESSSESHSDLKELTARNERLRGKKNKKKIKKDSVKIADDAEKKNTIASNNSTIVVNIKKQADSPNIFLKDEKDLELFKESWLTVAYKMLSSTNYFPTLNLPDFSETWIKTGDFYKRKNQRFDPDKAHGKDPNSPPTEFSFYVRLSGKNMFYSELKEDLNILGSLSVDALKRSEKFNNPLNTDVCFKVYDSRNIEWTLCAETPKLRNEWVCLIKKLLKETDVKECEMPIDEDVPITYFEKKVNQPILLIPLAAPYCNANWNYNSHGQDWECECKEGLSQSPINLPKWKKAILSPVKPVFNYEVVEATSTINTNDGQVKTQNHIKIVHKDYSVQVNAENFGNLITLDGAIYKAQKIVFHTPAEHTIGGKKFDMEMQIIHFGQTKGDIAKQVILSFLFTKRPGVYNQFLDDLDFFSLPQPIGTLERNLESNLYIPKIFYDTEDKDMPIMNDFSFYTYEGSLTSPPCTERTIVYVAADPIPIGSTALQLFEEALRVPDLMDNKGNVIISDILPVNNRAIQPTNGRNVFFYKKEEEVKMKQPDVQYKEEGHYEKMVKKTNNYYYVNNDKPSNMPGAIVVSKEEATGTANNWG